MKIVRLMGGLGNQMFQYALWYALKQRFPKEDVLVDYSYFKSVRVHNGLELVRVFGIDPPQASFGQLLKVTWPVYNYKLSRFIQKYIYLRKTELEDHPEPNLKAEIFSPGDKYYIGYWQDYRYIIDWHKDLQSLFQFNLKMNDKSAKIAQSLLADDCSVSLHVRRGDYLLDAGYAGLCGLDYYKRAINFMLENVSTPSFYVFSDDMTWTKENIVPLLRSSKYVMVDWNKGADSPQDMMLMSKCRHNIIANSSFSWWAAFLNCYENQIVCAPAKWTNHKVFTIRQLPEWQLF